MSEPATPTARPTATPTATPTVALPPGGPAARPRALDAGWRGVAAAFAFNGFLFGAWASRVPAFKDRLALGEAELGLVLLALAFGALSAFPVSGYLSERQGTHRVTLAAVALYGPALVLLALAPNIWLLALALFVFGTLHGGMDVAMNGWAAEVETRIARPTMSLFHALWSLGAGLGAATGWLAIRAGAAPPGHFLLAALVGGALATWLAARGAGAAPAAAREGEGGPVFALPRGSLVLVGLIAFGIAMGEGAMADWSAVFLREALGAGEGRAALGYAAYSTAMVATRLLGDRATARFGPVRTATASGLIAAAGLLVVILAPGLPVALAGFALVGMGYAVIMPLVFSRAARDPEVPPGHAIASVATLAYGGMLVGPALVGFVAGATSLAAAFGVLLLLALQSAAFGRFLRAPGAARA